MSSVSVERHRRHRHHVPYAKLSHAFSLLLFTIHIYTHTYTHTHNIVHVLQIIYMPSSPAICVYAQLFIASFQFVLLVLCLNALHRNCRTLHKPPETLPFSQFSIKTLFVCYFNMIYRKLLATTTATKKQQQERGKKLRKMIFFRTICKVTQ